MAKRKAVTAGTTQLICAFALSYAKSRFSHGAAKFANLCIIRNFCGAFAFNKTNRMSGIYINAKLNLHFCSNIIDFWQANILFYSHEYVKLYHYYYFFFFLFFCLLLYVHG